MSVVVLFGISFECETDSDPCVTYVLLSNSRLVASFNVHCLELQFFYRFDFLTSPNAPWLQSEFHLRRRFPPADLVFSWHPFVVLDFLQSVLQLGIRFAFDYVIFDLTSLRAIAVPAKLNFDLTHRTDQCIRSLVNCYGQIVKTGHESRITDSIEDSASCELAFMSINHDSFVNHVNRVSCELDLSSSPTLLSLMTFLSIMSLVSWVFYRWWPPRQLWLFYQ